MPDGGKRRYPRTERDLGEALLRHLSLLREFGRRAFDEGDDKFLGEVAAKLRLLCYRQGRNRPLLLDMMARYQSKVRCVSRVPPDMGRTRPLEEYLDEVCMVTPGPNGTVKFTNKELIGRWSQEWGGAHEDWDHSEEVVALRGQSVWIGGEHASVACLRSVYRTVLSVADAFLLELQNKGLIRPKKQPRSGDNAGGDE